MRNSPMLAVVALGSLVGAPAATAARPARWRTLPMPAAPPAGGTAVDLPVGDATLHAVVYGTGAPLVLLHGGFGNGEHWGGEVAALGTAFQVIVIDARGHGRSTRGTAPLSYHRMAEDVVAVLDALGVARAAVVGWSDGGVVGLDLAIHHGDRLSALVAFGANYATSGMRSPGDAATVTGYVARCRADYLRMAPLPRAMSALRRDLRAMWHREPAYTKAELAAITVPTTIADGEHDEYVKRGHTEAMAKLIAGARLVLMPAVSHFAPWQDPDGFAAMIVEAVKPAT